MKLNNILIMITIFSLLPQNNAIADISVIGDEQGFVRMKDEKEILSREDIKDILREEYETAYNYSVSNIFDNRVNTGPTEALPNTADEKTKQTNLDRDNNDYTGASATPASMQEQIAKYNVQGVGSESNRLNDSSISQWDELIMKAINEEPSDCPYEIPVNLIKAMICQESSGNQSATGKAIGLMQIQSGSATQDFINVGANVFHETWTSNDRYDPEKNIKYGVHRMAEALIHYNGDYMKAIQAHNFSPYSLDMLIREYGDDWINHTADMGRLNGYGSSYGDPKYVEHVLSKYT